MAFEDEDIAAHYLEETGQNEPNAMTEEIRRMARMPRGSSKGLPTGMGIGSADNRRKHFTCQLPGCKEPLRKQELVEGEQRHHYCSEDCTKEATKIARRIRQRSRRRKISYNSRMEKRIDAIYEED